MSRILIIEDDRAIALGLRLNLRRDGHEVRIAQDGETGLRMALEPDVDLIVLDVMLPGRNGYELLKEVRKQGSTASVLMLTAKGMESDKILGLKLGADDYLSKPFGLGELLARVEALLRRRPAAPEKSTVIRFGPVEVDLDRQMSPGTAPPSTSARRSSGCCACSSPPTAARSAATTSLRAAGARSTRAPRGRSTTSSARCGSSWSSTRRSLGTSSPCAVTDTASRGDPLKVLPTELPGC